MAAELFNGFNHFPAFIFASSRDRDFGSRRGQRHGFADS
jgi:hypothetical protein